MDLLYSKTVLSTLNFKLLLQACPFSLQFSSQVGLPHLNSLVTKNFPRGQKNDQILSFLLILTSWSGWGVTYWRWRSLYLLRGVSLSKPIPSRSWRRSSSSLAKSSWLVLARRHTVDWVEKSRGTRSLALLGVHAASKHSKLDSKLGLVRSSPLLTEVL